MSQAQYLTADTAERMASASEAAFRLMDSGENPTKAAASASVEAGLTSKQARHVALAINVAQANRAAGHPGTAWEKAAAFPVADPDAVAKIAAKGFRPDRPVAKRASDDFASPPPSNSSDAWEVCVRLKSLFPKDETRVAKAASAKPVPSKTVNPPSLWSQLRAVAYATDVAAAEAVKCASSSHDWPSIRDAARDLYPEAAGIVDNAISAYPQIKRASAAGASSFAPKDHPYLVAVGLLKRAVDMYTDSKAAEESAGILGDPGVALFKKAAPGDIKNPSAPKPSFMDRLIAGKDSPLQSGARSFLGASLKPLGAQILERGPSFDGSVQKTVARELGEENLRDSLVGTVNAPLMRAEKSVRQVAEQDNINDLLMHPSLAGADPNEILSAYRELRALAPNAMAVPALARQAVGLRVRTGQLGMFDLESLTRMESNIVKARQASHEDD